MESKTAVLFNKNVPVRWETDVLVAGGGPAGISAALAAVRQGCSVRLVEAHTCLGGMGTAGLVPVFMQFDDGKNFLAGGIGREILGLLRKSNGTLHPNGKEIRAEVLKRVYDQLLGEAGVAFTFHSKLIGVNTENGVVREAICSGKSELFAVRARVFIDCTGDGDLAVFAGAPYEKGDAQGRMMPGTLCSLWTQIDWRKVEEGGLGRGNARIEDAIRDKVFSLEDRHLPGIWPLSESTGGGNVGHTFNLDGTDEESLTRAYVWARKTMPEYERYYKEYMKGFERMELVATAPLMGVRETRRILGDYVLNLEDFKARAVFPDEIGRYAYPVDIHIANPDKKSYDAFLKEFTGLRLGKGESYGIPYRVLTPRGLKNVLVAGRCVSTDRSMQASLRVMPGCFITGQAAGLAAAMMAAGEADSRRISVSELQARLKKMGAFLPNC